MIKSEAQKLKDNGIAIIPLFPNAKKNHDTDILTKEYKVSEVQPNGNLGVNLKQSDMYCIDPDTAWAIKFGEMWIPRDTRIGGRINNGKKELTKFFYKSDGSLKQNIKDRKDNSGETIAELFCDHNIVVYGSTPNKETQRPMKRYWESESQLATFNESIRAIYDKICFASAIAPHLNQTNQGGLILDSCLWRYCKDWSDDDRINFLTDFFNVVRPNSKHNNRKAWERIIKSNNNQETNNAGYEFFANYIGVDREKVRKWVAWIGETPGQTKSKSKIPKLEIITGDDIYFSEDVPINWAIENILPEGMCIIAALPKIGKSWLALQISLAVENALEVLGFKVKQGRTLYCAYEDNRKRIKRRFKTTGVKPEDKRPNFIFKSSALTEGLEEQIEDWIKETPDARLVVIDTYYHALPKNLKRSNKERYEIDSQNLSGLQRIALDYNITILIVHHTTKGKHDDTFNEISGSVGMQSIADTLWVISSDRKAKKDSILEITGRDIESDSFQIGLDVNCKWLNKGRPGENKETEDQKLIIKIIKELDQGPGVYPREVVAHLKLTDKTEIGNLKKRMKRMLDNNELMKGQKGGQYKNMPF